MTYDETYAGKCYTCEFYWMQACRRYPPVLLPFSGPGHRYGKQWPNVEWTDWCGEHKAKADIAQP